ncbi:Crp/Fnr family transcriptional regulator [Algoriphagus zhangzhouensis]|uniref:cAMP-binding domain of CRP or a regulatory subunit of cAMP-dependent protein kinases n=1 Tax=Algoriphagus zhangzhouensis TaxID=1073327 RepID=A0A1M7ZJZ4_9BACT|nr:Crp/Fnr family transcriptional regulator [Algoriphagus zhangzhouensis]TDY43576.1 CRP-like cAMP-binding protein [Algoriphagus zhangzhouensis]SHO64986.1 cAMP-binding domain of CRP or a regulatory subunit of cAMP-dependent protein kinases [Algoriphagus zhangzhouensis]
MDNKFVNYFSKISSLTKEEAEAIAQTMKTQSFEKGDYLLRQGQKSSKTYFILSGCIREYILTDGEEKTTNFFTEEQWAISLNGFTPENSATHNWVCVEDTTVVVGDEEQAQAIFKRFPRFETISRTIMEAAFSEQREALTSYYTDSPEQRYLKLLKSRPDLIQRIPQYHLASYIGVKPESLSRIRKRISSSE